MSNLHYFHPDWITPAKESLTVDVCVYGGTACGVIAGITAARRGRSVVVLQPGKHIGGMTTGGLGWTDFGRKYVIGGISRTFYQKLGSLFGKDEEWAFPPSAAKAVLQQMVDEAGLDIRRCQYLDRVQTKGRRITAVTCLGGLRVAAKMFIDASYEGDLMAKAGVSHAVGRESNNTYGESLNGIQIRHWHQFSHPVDPYRIEGDPSSGLLPLIESEDMTSKQGQGDHRIQSYNFRVCMTNDPAMKIAWRKPAAFEPDLFVLATRWFKSEKDQYNEHLRDASPWVPLKFDRLPNKTPGGYDKTDTNNHGPVSSDFIGGNHAWPQGSYETREAIFQRHVAYQQGFYWHMANCPEIPSRYREAYAHWGLPRDEFIDTDHWPHQLYVRESRRLVGDYVITEHDCTGASRAEDAVGMGSYNMDSHNTTRFVKVDRGRARVINEGDVQVGAAGPYPVSYRAITPKRGECENLFIPVCFSASHIAYGSARMEPVFMVLGQSAAVAADLAIAEEVSVQNLPYKALRPELEKAHQVLETPVSLSSQGSGNPGGL